MLHSEVAWALLQGTDVNFSVERSVYVGFDYYRKSTYHVCLGSSVDDVLLYWYGLGEILATQVPSYLAELSCIEPDLRVCGGAWDYYVHDNAVANGITAYKIPLGRNLRDLEEEFCIESDKVLIAPDIEGSGKSYSFYRTALFYAYGAWKAHRRSSNVRLEKENGGIL